MADQVFRGIGAEKIVINHADKGKCAHPNHRSLLQEYFDMAKNESLARKAGHEPQLLDRVFKMQVNLAQNGT